MAGINHYIFLSAVILGLGIFTAASNKNIFRILSGIALIFTASVINIAAFTGFLQFNPEGQIILYLSAFVIIMTIIIGIGLFYKHYTQTGKADIDYND